MENNTVNTNVEENVNNQVTDEAQGTNNVPQNEPPKNEPDLNKEDNSDKKKEDKPTFKEKFISGAKKFGEGCKTAAKTAKPYVVGAAIGVGAVAITALKVYRDYKNGEEGGTALGKSDTPLLDGPSDEMDYSGEDGLTNFESDVVDTVEVGDVQMEDISGDI